VHSAVDGFSRLAYSEVLEDEQGRTASAFWLRAVVFFASHDIALERVLTDMAAATAAVPSRGLSGTSCTHEPGPTDRPPTARFR